MPKYNMSIENNICVGRRNVVSYTHHIANIVGIDIDYFNVQSLLDDYKPAEVSIADALEVSHLLSAFRRLFDEPGIATDPQYLTDINISLSGQTPTLPIPYPYAPFGEPRTSEPTPYISKYVGEIAKISDPIEQALSLCAWLLVAKPFHKFNEATAFLAGDSILMSHGYGFIDVQDADRLRQLVDAVKKNGNMDELKTFLYDSIDGMNFK